MERRGLRLGDVLPPTEFLFGLDWSPQTAIREGQVGQSGSFGAVPVFAGTLLITAIAMCVSVPVGLISAIYLADYADPRVRAARTGFPGIQTVGYLRPVRASRPSANNPSMAAISESSS